MYIQFQSSDEKYKKVGGFVSCSNPNYLDNKQAKEDFFKSLTDETIFVVGNGEKINLHIISAKRTGKQSAYLEFSAIAAYFGGEIDVPITGIISFSI